jgi:REP element-mobilizing transposase RayT
MPNHVHLLLREREGKCLAWAMQTLKSYTAHKVNKVLGCSGRLWEREYFDRLVRPGTFEVVKDYILRNPNKAKLQNCDWVRSIIEAELQV